MIASWMWALLFAAPGTQTAPAVAEPPLSVSNDAPAANNGPPLQSLQTFLSAAKTYAIDNRAQLERAAEQTAETYSILGRELPTLNARGVYTYNQYEAAIPAATAGFLVPGATGALYIQRHNQLDGYLTASMPLIDVGTWIRSAGAKPAVEALRKSVEARELDVQRQVARQYYNVLGDAALIDSANRSLKVSQENLDLLQARRQGGVASDLDVERAIAEVEQRKQAVANAILGNEVARRELRTLSGVEPGGEGQLPQDDLHDENGLAEWTKAIERGQVPSLVAAEQNAIAAHRNATGFYLAYLPTVVGTAQEHLSNVQGFTGKYDSYLLQLTATWQLDLTTWFNARAQSAIAAQADVSREQALLQAQDSIHNTWFQVRTEIANTRAALAQVKAAQHAAEVARDRYQSGAATQLDVVQAERDAFSADVNRISAQANLAYARAELRLFSGQSLLQGAK